MSLRNKLLLLFVVFAVVPLIALGVINHRQTVHALEDLLGRQTHALAERAAAEITERYRVQRSDMLLLAENEETQKLMRARAAGDSAAVRAILAEAMPYFDQVWQQFSPSYRMIELRAANNELVLRLGDLAEAGTAARDAEPALRFEQPIINAAAGKRVGTAVAFPQYAQLLPEAVLAMRFGASGYNAVIDRSTGSILYHPHHPYIRQPVQSALGVRAEELTNDQILLRGQDSVRVASAVALDAPPWTVVATTGLDEFAPPFRSMLRNSMILLLLVTVAVSVAFAVAIRRATRSLAALTAAADAVGRGDFAPQLPAAGNDEIGRLALAFGLMTSKVRETMTQIERSRQMAAIGEFAAEIAHEVRNPLTSIKLNLQRITRIVGSEGTPSALAGPLKISLRAIDRMENVVGGVLLLGRPRTLKRTEVHLHEVITAALATVQSQADRQRVGVDVSLDAGDDVIQADAMQIEGVLLNLFLNALDAMADGGALRVTTETDEQDGTDVIAVRVADTGHGIPEAERDQLYRPFYTTKPNGTGLGLSTALRTAEEHGGTLRLESANGAGAVFRFALPLAPRSVPV